MFFSSSFSRKINHPWRPANRSPPSHALTNCYIGGSQGQKLQKVPWLNRQPRHLIPMKNACHDFNQLEKNVVDLERSDGSLDEISYLIGDKLADGF